MSSVATTESSSNWLHLRLDGSPEYIKPSSASIPVISSPEQLDQVCRELCKPNVIPLAIGITSSGSADNVVITKAVFGDPSQKPRIEQNTYSMELSTQKPYYNHDGKYRTNVLAIMDIIKVATYSVSRVLDWIDEFPIKWTGSGFSLRDSVKAQDNINQNVLSAPNAACPFFDKSTISGDIPNLDITKPDAHWFLANNPRIGNETEGSRMELTNFAALAGAAIPAQFEVDFRQEGIAPRKVIIQAEREDGSNSTPKISFEVINDSTLAGTAATVLNTSSLPIGANVFHGVLGSGTNWCSFKNWDPETLEFKGVSAEGDLAQLSGRDRKAVEHHIYNTEIGHVKMKTDNYSDLDQFREWQFGLQNTHENLLGGGDSQWWRTISDIYRGLSGQAKHIYELIHNSHLILDEYKKLSGESLTATNVSQIVKTKSMRGIAYPSLGDRLNGVQRALNNALRDFDLGGFIHTEDIVNSSIFKTPDGQDREWKDINAIQVERAAKAGDKVALALCAIYGDRASRFLVEQMPETVNQADLISFNGSAGASVISGIPQARKAYETNLLRVNPTVKLDIFEGLNKMDGHCELGYQAAQRSIEKLQELSEGVREAIAAELNLDEIRSRAVRAKLSMRI